MHTWWAPGTSGHACTSLNGALLAGSAVAVDIRRLALHAIPGVALSLAMLVLLDQVAHLLREPTA